MKRRIMSILQKIKDYLPIRSKSFYKRSSETDQHILNLSPEITALSAEITTLSAEMHNAIAKLNDLQTSITTQDAILNNLQANINTHAAILNDLQTNINSHGIAIQNNLQTNFNTHTAIMNDLQTNFNTFCAQTTARQAYFIRETMPYIIHEKAIAQYNQQLLLPQNNRTEIPVVFITDSAYLIPAMTAVSSLLRHANKDVYYKIHIIGYNLPVDQIQKYSSLSQAICFHAINEDYSYLATEHPWVSPAALLKFDLPNLLSEYDKVLYLDSDMLIYDDLQELYNLEIIPYYAAVVKDFIGMEIEQHHKKMEHSDYFNTGMMLLNLKKMREDNIQEQLFEAKKNDPWKHFMDQDAFNQVFAENVFYTSPRYNLMLANLYKYNIHPARVANFYSIPIKEVKQIMNKPAIQHLSNIDKPWFSTSGIDYECWYMEKAFLDSILSLRENVSNTKPKS